MTAQELAIYKELQKHPGEMYLTPDGSAIYALTEGGMLCITSELDLRTKTEAEINEFVVNSLT